MKTTHGFLLLAMLTGLTPTASQAQSPFDGTWRGQSITDQGRCPHRYDVAVSIKGGRITGTMVSRNRTLTVGSRVDPGGRVDQVFAHDGRTVLKVMSGRLGSDRGRLSWMAHGETNRVRGSSCYGTITLERTGP